MTGLQGVPSWAVSTSVVYKTSSLEASSTEQTGNGATASLSSSLNKPTSTEGQSSATHISSTSKSALCYDPKVLSNLPCPLSSTSSLATSSELGLPGASTVRSQAVRIKPSFGLLRDSTIALTALILVLVITSVLYVAYLKDRPGSGGGKGLRKDDIRLVQGSGKRWKQMKNVDKDEIDVVKGSARKMSRSWSFEVSR